MKVCFETFGCRLNRAEALEDEARYLAIGHQAVTDHDEADFFVIRGCSVTARAQRDCERLIEHLRRKYPNKQVYITGCLKSAKPLPIKKAADTSVPTRTARAYLKVQDGCAGECTFCIVPSFRGKSVSVPFAEVLDKAKRFIEAGYHELVVTGCNLSLYASDGKRLPELVAALAELDAGCRVRLGSLEPHLVAGETIHAMAEHDNVCKFIHLPIQSAADRLLVAMKRPYTVAQVEALISLARKLMPYVAIGCDMMAGFPGESEHDQRLSEMLLERQRIVNVHAFHFSPRPGTPAAAMPLHIPRELALKRTKALPAIAEKNLREFARSFMGRPVEVLIEKEGETAGWTGEHLWFEEKRADGLNGAIANERRQIVRFRVQEAHGGRLFGVRIRGQ